MIKKLLIIFLLCNGVAWAQTNPNRKINFQGKIFNAGAAINGTGNFQFFIAAASWGQTFNNVPINDGLYSVVLGSGTSPLPGNLFNGVDSVQMSVTYNSTLIDNVWLYAPIEKDYTVPDNLKDGVSWSEIQSIPTLDTDPANEIQTLNLNGSVLSLTPNGGQVTLSNGGSIGAGDVTINGNLTVMDTAVSEMHYQPNYTTSLASTNAFQSFKAIANGSIRKIRVTMAVNGNTFVTVKVFDQDGVTGQLLSTNIVSITDNPTQMQDRYLDISSSNLGLNVGNIYFFQIIAPSGGTVDLRYSASDPYPYGYCHVNNTSDLVFGIYIDNSNPPNMTFNSSGYLGLGTSNPQSQLDVNGRIRDQTGWVMPVGSVLPYFGNTAPDGWLLCDGSAKSRLTYNDLFSAIGTNCGEGDGSSTFNVPDLRGRFLRGISSFSGNDPDALTRTAMNQGGQSGNNVGSLQQDAFQGHWHSNPPSSHSHAASNGVTFTAISDVAGGGGGSPVVEDAISDGINGTPRKTSETRPKNVYVNYIIKY